MSDKLVTWLRRRIEERRYLAQHAIELGNNAEWVEQSSGVLVTSEPTEGDTWYGTWAMGDSSLTRLMEANDPRDTIARCEAELAILDLYESQAAKEFDNAMEEDRTWTLAPVVHLLGYGYRFRDGYREEWAP